MDPTKNPEGQNLNGGQTPPPIFSNSTPTPPSFTGSGSGDIVLPSSSPNPRSSGSKIPGKTIAIIVGFIAVVAVLIIALIVMNKSSGNKPNKTSSTSPAEQYYNKFANYVISGDTNNTKSIANQSLPIRKYYIYKVNRQLSFVDSSADIQDDDDQSVAEPSAFIDQARQYLDDFNKVFNDSNSTDLAKSLALKTNGLFEVLSTYYLSKPYTESELADLYLKNGRKAAIDGVDKKYQSLSEIKNNIFAEQLYRYVTERDKFLIDTYRIYESSGCIKNQSVVESCAGKTNARLQYLMELPPLIRQVSDYEKELISAITGTCFSMSSEFTDPVTPNPEGIGEGDGVSVRDNIIGANDAH